MLRAREHLCPPKHFKGLKVPVLMVLNKFRSIKLIPYLFIYFLLRAYSCPPLSLLSVSPRIVILQWGAVDFKYIEAVLVVGYRMN